MNHLICNVAVKLGLISVILAAILGADLGHAVPADSIVYKGQDIRPLVDFVNSQVRTVQRPFFIYHWGQNSNSGPITAADAEARAQRQSLAFVNGLPVQGRTNGGELLYGPGYYFAVDPVISEMYGGIEGAEWELTQVQIPSGFRMLDVSSWDQFSTPIEPLRIGPINQVLLAFDCPTSEYASSYSVFADILTNDGLTPKCSDLIQKVFTEFSKIDGFTYIWLNTNYSICGIDISNNEQSFSRAAAIVLTSDRWIKSGSNQVQIFNKNSSDNTRMRQIVESLRYLSDKDSTRTAEAYLNTILGSTIVSSEIKNKYPEYKSYSVVSIKVNCTYKSICNINAEVNIYSSNGVDEKTLILPLPPVPPPVNYPPVIGSTHIGFHPSPLWRDLIGKATEPKIESWMKQNLFNCGSPSWAPRK